MGKWDEIIKQVVIELENYRREGYDKPTLRSMFYRLYTSGIFPNTRSSYISLGNATVKAEWMEDYPKIVFLIKFVK